jgi:hypothetical protein
MLNYLDGVATLWSNVVPLRGELDRTPHLS